MIWSQFAAYHVDRCEAVAQRLAGRVAVRAIEVATTSRDYAWEPSGAIAAAEKVTLFPGRSFDEIPAFQRYRAMLRATSDCDTVCMGLSYAEPDAILLSWTLRLSGKRVVVFSESKFDDKPRSVWTELGKSILLACYSAAVVGGKRHFLYFRFLRFLRRTVVPGYDVVGLDRVRRQADGAAAPQGRAFADRPFVFVGRFVDKKNLLMLVEGFARYAAAVGSAARRLKLVGSGEFEPALRQASEALGTNDLIDFTGFLSAQAVSRELSAALALVLVSQEEQWGLVVNEAMALGLPVIVSDEVGSRDLLVRNLVNGYVVDSGSAESIAAAMRLMDGNAADWEKMVDASHQRSWMGDADRLADAIEYILFPSKGEAFERIAKLMSEMRTCEP